MENLNMLFRLVADETNVSKPVVNLKTAEIDTTVSQKLKSLYGKPPSIFMIPGLEGAASVFDTLAEKIIHPALGLQFPYNNIEANSDMFEITRRMIKASVSVSVCVKIAFFDVVNVSFLHHLRFFLILGYETSYGSQRSVRSCRIQYWSFNGCRNGVPITRRRLQG